MHSLGPLGELLIEVPGIELADCDVNACVYMFVC